MFDYMSSPRAFLDTSLETAFLFIAAAMRNDRRHQLHHPLGETIDAVGRFLFVITNVKAHYDQLFPVAAPVVGPAERPHFQNFHRFRFGDLYPITCHMQKRSIFGTAKLVKSPTYNSND